MFSPHCLVGMAVQRESTSSGWADCSGCWDAGVRHLLLHQKFHSGSKCSVSAQSGRSFLCERSRLMDLFTLRSSICPEISVTDVQTAQQEVGSRNSFCLLPWYSSYYRKKVCHYLHLSVWWCHDHFHCCLLLFYLHHFNVNFLLVLSDSCWPQAKVCWVRCVVFFFVMSKLHSVMIDRGKKKNL